MSRSTSGLCLSSATPASSPATATDDGVSLPSGGGTGSGSGASAADVGDSGGGSGAAAQRKLKTEGVTYFNLT